MKMANQEFKKTFQWDYTDYQNNKTHGLLRKNSYEFSSLEDCSDSFHFLPILWLHKNHRILNQILMIK